MVLSPAPAVQMVEVDDEAILVDEARGSLHLLNAPGALVWRCLDGESSLTEIAADIADILGVPFEVVLTDAESLAQRLLDDGLATSPDRPVPPPVLEEHDHEDDGCIAIPEPVYDPRALPEPHNL